MVCFFFPSITPLDRAHRELSSDTLTLISHWENTLRKNGENWRSEIAKFMYGENLVAHKT